MQKGDKVSYIIGFLSVFKGKSKAVNIYKQSRPKEM